MTSALLPAVADQRPRNVLAPRPALFVEAQLILVVACLGAVLD